MTRRVLRILLDVATAMSLVLCLMSVGMGVRSEFYGDRWARLQYVQTGNYWQQLLSQRGVLVWAAERPLHRTYEEGGPGRGWHHSAWARSPRDRPIIAKVVWRPNGLEHWGFAYRSEWHAGTEEPNWRIVPHHVLAAPYWFIALVSALAPALAAVRWSRNYRTRARAKSGRCRQCGYDLRATPERCPECGRLVESS